MAMNNAAAVLLFALVLVFAAATHTRVTADLDPLLPTCKSLGGGSTYFGIDFCISALGSDGRSRRPGITERNLSAIAVDLLTANVTSTAGKIASLIREGAGDATTRRGLSSCQALYGGILQRQPGCAAAIHDGRFHDATSSLETSASAAKECENGFSKSNVASPLIAEDDNAFKLAKLAVALLSFAP